MSPRLTAFCVFGLLVSAALGLLSWRLGFPAHVALNAISTAGFVTSALFLAADAYRKHKRQDRPPPPWKRPGLVLYYLGTPVMAFGLWRFLSPVDEASRWDLDGLWIAGIGLGVMLLGRLVGRGRL